MEKVKNVSLFEYAIIFSPTLDPQSKKKEQEKPAILCLPRIVLAKDSEEAKLLAAAYIPDEYTDRLDEVEVIVRPFVGGEW